MSIESRQKDSTPNCFKCSQSLIGKQYLIQDKKKFCVLCFEETYCNNCKFCKQLIKTDQQVCHLFNRVNDVTLIRHIGYHL